MGGIVKKSDKGTAYMDVILVVFISVLVLSVLIGIVPVFIENQKLTYVTREVLKEAEIRGNTGTDVNNYYDSLIETVGVTPKSISFEGTTYIDGTKNVQINEKIQITIKSDFSFFNTYLGNGFDIELSSVMTGRSGVYYK